MPQITKITLAGFGRYTAKTEVDLPTSGVVLLQGPNGAGKSTLINSVSWALFGRTLGGGRMDSEGTEVVVTGPWGQVTRTRGKTAAAVSAVLGGAQVEPFTASAGNKLIETSLGTWDSWHRAEVLSSSEGRAFGSASDAERKALLEELLGLHVFDSALESAKADLATAKKACAAGGLKAASLSGAITSYAAFLRDRPPIQFEPPRPSALPPMTAQERLELRDVWVAISNELSRATMTAERAKDALKALKRGVCLECNQPRDAGQAGVLQETLNQAVREIARLETEKYESGKALEAARQQMATWTEANETYKNWEATQSDAWSKAESSLAKASADLAECQADLARVEARAALLTAVVETLGPRGARVLMMDQAVAALNDTANFWLTKLGLDPVFLKVDQGKITIDVPWRGGSYASLSGGERRRLDLAFQLGLSQMVGGGGTLWLDEAFDALDVAGAKAAVEVIHELAQERCVVVISHNAALQGALNPDVVLTCPLS